MRELSKSQRRPISVTQPTGSDELGRTSTRRARGTARLLLILGAAAILAALALASPAGAEHLTPGLPQTSLVDKNLPMPPAGDPLLPFLTESGLISLSVDAIGTNNPEGGPLKVHKNASGATVRQAYLFAASTGETDYTPVNGDVTLDGTPVEWEPSHTISSDINSVNVVANVTSIVKEKIDAAPAGDVTFTAAEPNNPTLIDGEILAVTLNDPTVTEPNSVTLLYGAQNPLGDTFHIGLAEPINKTNPNFALNLSLGISYGYQPAGQYSVVHVNEKLLTSSAGGQDDCYQKYEPVPDYQEPGCENGDLITAGGIGDTTEDPPEPEATDETCKNAAGEPAPRCDDELYSLLPFVTNGETELTFETLNPSDNDNIFFAALETHSNAAVVGEGITLAPTSATNKVGQPHTLTATVQNESGKRLEGVTVHFEVTSGPNAGTKGEAATDEHGEAKFTYTSKIEGTDHIVATFENSKGETVDSNVAEKTWEPEVVVTPPSSTQLSTSLSGGGHSGAVVTVPEGTAVTDGATLSGENASKATGKAVYKVYSDKECADLITEAGEVEVAGGTVPASNAKTLPPGTYYWQASYSGDPSNEASESTCGSEVETVEKAAVAAKPTQLSTSLSGGGHSGAVVTVSEGTAVTDGATLSGENASKATGKAVYKVYSDKECADLITEAGEVEVAGGTVPASNAETLPPGTYYWQASYSGDPSNEASESTCGSEVETVEKAAVTPKPKPTRISTSLSGGGRWGATISVSEGTPVSDTATLSGTNTSKATGTVEYSVYSDAKCTKLVTSAGAVSVSGGKVPASNAETLPPGTYYWQVSYSGDANNLGSKSTCCSEIETVLKPKPKPTQISTSLSGGSQSGPKITVAEGTAVSDSATLSGTNAATATGTVEYRVYSNTNCTKLVTSAGVVSVSGGKVPASNAETLPPGAYYWQVSYSGDTSNLGSKSTCCSEIETVLKPKPKPTQISTSLSGGGQSGATITVPEGTPVTDLATLTGENAALATGKVTYKVYSDEKCTKLVISAGTVVVSLGWVPASNAETLPAGTYYWQATYSGDSSNLGSTSAYGSEVETVTKQSKGHHSYR